MMNMKHIDQMGVFLIAALLMYFPGIAAFRPSMHPNDVPPLTVKTNRRPLLPASICTSLTSEYVRLSPLISTTQGSSSCSSGTTKSTLVASSRNVTVKPTPTLRRKWGVDNEQDREYWFDSRIHVFGNSGFWGAFHAAVAPLSTHWIDIVAYNGVDIRQRLAAELARHVKTKNGARVLDLCCGTGFSTRALCRAFPDAQIVLGLDTSAEMIAMAKFITKHLVAVKPLSTSPCKKHTPSSQTFHDAGFALSNAQDTKLPAKSFDLVTIMWAFHEAPQWGRDKIIKEARRLLSPGGTLAVIDIATDYVPSKSMLMGEPFVKEYQQHIHQQLAQFKGFRRLKYVDVVPRHLGMWTLTRSATIA